MFDMSNLSGETGSFHGYGLTFLFSGAETLH